MSRRAWILGPLGRRLLAAFAVVSLWAVGLVAVLSMRAVQTQTVGLEAGQRDRAEQAIVAALAHAYRAAGSWERADLTTARALAQAAGLQVVVLNAVGGPVARLEPTAEPTTRPQAPVGTPSSGSGSHGTGGTSTTRPTSVPSGSGSGSGSGTVSPTTNRPGRGQGSPGTGQPGRPGPGGGRAWPTSALPVPGGTAGPVMALVAVRVASGSSAGSSTAPASAATAAARASGAGIPVMVDGVTVGRALIEPAPRVPVPAEAARRAILRTVGWAALAAAVLAVLVSFLAMRRLTRPLTALASAARAVERGDPEASRLLRPGPGELGEVSAAFAQMAATVRRTDELRRAMAADVAHELRTPVTILRGSTEEILDGLAPVTREAVASLHDEVLRLERLVEDLAALSAAQAAGLSLRTAPVDLGGLVRRAVAQLRTRLAEAQHTATVTVDEDGCPLLVDGDDDRLTQVVTNLLVNAIAYTPPGGRIGVDVRRRGVQVAVTVTDTGPGISPGVLPHVFERFYRGASTAGRRGTGIGLAVVAELVSAHGGTVGVTSPPGQGAEFTVLLPCPASCR
jgi:two-component system sensor histidine kinase BaeS